MATLFKGRAAVQQANENQYHLTVVNPYYYGNDAVEPRALADLPLYNNSSIAVRSRKPSSRAVKTTYTRYDFSIWGVRI